MSIDTNEFFRQVTIRICGSLDIKTALANTLRYLRDILPITSMSMIIYDPELNIAHIIASVGDELEARFGNKVILPPEGLEFRAARWASMEPVEIINRPDLIPERVKVIETLNLDMNVSSIEMRLELVVLVQLQVRESKAAVGSYVDGRGFAGFQVFHLHCRAGNQVV